MESMDETTTKESRNSVRPRVIFKKVNHNRPHNYGTCLIHILFSGISFFCWRQVSKFPIENLAKSSQLDFGGVFLFANGLYVFLILHSFLGIVRFGHPLSNSGLRCIYEISFNLVRIAPVPIITVQLLETFVGLPGSTLDWYLDHNYLLYFSAITLVLALLNELFQSFAIIKLFILVTNIVILLMIGVSAESYWTLFMAVLLLLNNCGLDIIASRYSISLIEIFLVGLCFFAVFALNSLLDIIDLARERY